jgi:hypothetical protein
MCRDAAQLPDGTGCCNRDTFNRKCVLADQEELPPLFGRPVRLLFSGTNERGLLMKDTMDGALFWWMGALATGIVVAVAALMS